MSEVVRVCQIDGSLPNLALMRLASWHRERGDDVRFYRGKSAAARDAFEPDYARVYASAIFRFSKPLIDKFVAQWPGAILGGTGTDSPITVEAIAGDHDGLDYSIDPSFKASIGFTQRGCRLSCKFCVVPQKEGKVRGVSAIADIWRGDPYPRWLHLLDNDFFGQVEWADRMAEIRDGGFKVCFSQGINVRAMTEEVAASLATVEYRNNDFNRRRLYTAWDNLKDEEVFFRGVDTLERHGIPPSHLMAYMLVGFDKKETWERIHHRFDRMVARGIKPYPMVFDCRATDPERYHGLRAFARWAAMGLYRAFPFTEYRVSIKSRNAPDEDQLDLALDVPALSKADGA